MPKIHSLLSCSFCSKPQSEVGKLVAGPGVYICDEDIRRAEAAAGVARGEVKCSFCSKWRRQVGKLVAGPDVFICDECIALCLEIIEIEISPQIGEGALSDAELESQALAATVEPAAGPTPNTVGGGGEPRLSRFQRALIKVLRKSGLDVSARRR